MQVSAKSAAHRKPVALTPWEQAERSRETLEAVPEDSRTKADYTQTIDAFRAIYHDSPRDVHAASAVNAVAELLAEQGRSLHDAKSLKAAVGQYEFLRTQYPGSSLRVGALLAEAQIFANDLADTRSAREKYALLIKQYPHSGLAEEARAGLTGLDNPNPTPVQSAEVAASQQKHQPQSSSSIADASHPRTVEPPAASSTSSVSAISATAGTPATSLDAFVDRPQPTAPVVAKAVAHRHGALAQVTGIRHWSTPNYTRVAIDLGDDVTYEAARVPNPDRIYFDLHGTRLAQELVGKSFAVTDDGFLKKIRAAQFSNDMTRVVLDVNDVTEYSAFLLPNPYRLIIDIHGGSKELGIASHEQGTAEAAPAATAGSSIAEVPAPRTASTTRPTQAHPVPNTVTTRSTNTTEIAALSTQPDKINATSMPTSQPISAVVKTPATAAVSAGKDVATTALGTPLSAAATEAAVPNRRIRKGKSGKEATSDAVPARAAVPTADGQTSLVRALGLKIGRIVIDAGHGGHDSGTIGAAGIEEKDVVLDVALRVGKLLHDRLGAEIVYTRSDDTFIPLETRTAIANKAQADLFLSIHANSSTDPSARGVETYYLNFTSAPDALETAARENAVSDQSIHQLSDLVKKIALKDKIAESREFASDVEKSLYGGLQRGNAGLKDRGVKKAPFVVLIGANMPSILAEISFVTNPKDASELRQPDYRERVAESLYKGVAKYAGGLSSVKGATERASVK